MAAKDNAKRIWRKIFQELSDDGGNTIKWSAMEQALRKMRMDITVQELELFGNTKQVMDFNSFFSTIQSGVKRRVDACRSARMVSEKRKSASYDTNYETMLQTNFGGAQETFLTSGLC